MRHNLFLSLLALVFCLSSCEQKQTNPPVTIQILHTTDVHGNVFPYDFIRNTEGKGSYSRICTYVDALRKSGATTLLLDGGDILQGQPTAYYYNFIDTVSPHLMAEVLNYLNYDAVTIGNHDIEPGHDVYDRWAAELKMPLLGANAIRVPSAENKVQPYFKPYTIVNKNGIRIAVLGLVTPSIPQFLPPLLWSGMEFKDVVQTAQQLMPQIQAKQPDLVIALIHSGKGDENNFATEAENAGYALARQVEGINLVLCGHDHQQYLDSVTRSSGSKTYIINPGMGGNALSQITATIQRQGDSVQLQLTPTIIQLDKYVPDNAFIQQFTPQYNAVKNFVSETVGTLTQSVDAHNVLFGPSAFTDLIHQVQLSLFDSVHISISAPLNVEANIPQGDIRMSDLFQLYPYENGIYLMSLTGEEVQKELEASYARWVNTMETPNDHLIQVKPTKDPNSPYLPTLHPTYNYDSACGIRYTVDVTKPQGQRVQIIAMADGSPFNPQARYRVVMNSYRASGGGNLLTEGAGIPKEELTQRVIETKPKDFRFYLREYLQKNQPLTPQVVSQWAFIPAEWVKPAAQRDSLYLFQK